VDVQGKPGFRRDNGRPLAVIERYLGTDDHKKAKAKARDIIAEIERAVDRARTGGAPLDVELEAIATRAMHDAFDILSARLIHYDGKLAKFAEEITEWLSHPLSAEWEPNPLLGGARTGDYAESKVRAIQPGAAQEIVAAVARDILRGQRIAIDRVTKGVQLPPMAPRERLMGVPSDGPKVSEAAEAYFAHPETKLSKGYARLCRVTYRLFADHVADAPLASVTRQQVDSFAIALSGLRATWGLHAGAKGLKFPALCKQFPAEDGNGISAATVNRYLASLGALWTFAQNKGLIDLNLKAPFGSQRRKAEEADNVPIPVADLNKLLAADSDLTLQWAILVGAYTGLRAAEVGNLRASEVKQSEAGTWFFNLKARTVASDDPTDSTKSKAGLREIPMHGDLIRLGLLKIVPAKGPIFAAIKPRPDGNRAAPLSAKFKKVAVRCGLPWTFRELRNTFKDALDRGDVSDQRRQMLMGHAREKMGKVYNRPGLYADDLRETIAKVRFDGLKLPKVKP